jgi:hypothetical protein
VNLVDRIAGAKRLAYSVVKSIRRIPHRLTELARTSGRALILALVAALGFTLAPTFVLEGKEDATSRRLTRQMAAQDIKKVDSRNRRSIRPERVTVTRTPQGKPKRVIRPREFSDRTTYFQLIQDKRTPGRLVLVFRSRDRDWVLKADRGLVAQFNSEEHLDVKPFFFTEASWPKTSNKVVLQYKKTKKTERNEVIAEIVYHVCSRSRGTCKRETQRLEYELEHIGAKAKRMPARNTPRRSKK